MIKKIANENLIVSVDTHGAELKSVQDMKTGLEYMWSGNPDVWGRVSPVLFPFVGRLKNMEYTYKGVTYPTTPHGFARDTDFTVTREEDGILEFTLEDSPESLKVYPFEYRLTLRYELKERSLKLTYIVKNKSDDVMYFSIGGHPAFKCPKDEGEKRSDYFIRFNKNDEALDKVISHDIDMNTGLTTDNNTTYELYDGYLIIKDNLFHKDALVLENRQANSVSLCGKDMIPYLTVDFDAPLFGVWSSVRPGADYVCIEPWWGRCDSNSFYGTLEEREYGNRLEGKDEFTASFTVSFN